MRLPGLFLFLLLLLSSSYLVVTEDDVDRWPTILIAMLARNKEHTLPYTLSLLSNLDYPKDRISLWIKSDHNNDRTIEVLKLWLNKEGNNYHNIQTEMDETSLGNFADEESLAHWSKSRFEHVISLREMALNHARNVWADFLFMIDADIFITQSSTLKDLVLKNLNIVAPMLKSDGLYSNFWCGMTENYYYKRTDEYKDILDRKDIGCFKVPMIHSAVLINLRRRTADELTYNPSKINSYDGPIDDIIAFAVSANKSNVALNICNDKIYGYIMVPLDKKDSLETDRVQLTNLKVESIYDESLLTLDRMFDRYTSLPTMDKMGFDEVYMINLLRRPDRKQKMYMCFEQIGLDVKLIEAVDGKSLDDAALETWGVKLMSNYLDPYHSRPMTLGEIGCFLSHYVIWKDVVDANHAEVMVLEDDIRFEPYFRLKLQRVREQIQHNNIEWDLIYIGRKRLQDEDEPNVSPSLVKAGYSYWTLAYLLSNRGARKLLDAEPLSNLLPVDEYLPIMFDRHPESSWSEHFPHRDLIGLSVSPLLVYPTHYTGEDGYISDTEDSVQVSPTSFPIVLNEKEDL
ncbi:glycosyltransferase 25 family member [Arctopsyche grandis]|uniref:glycosyltransferase 25 family member n=1 Tax=Arctopsyche grandis TaxID=121162 RepID=UPI00406D89B1